MAKPAEDPFRTFRTIFRFAKRSPSWIEALGIKSEELIGKCIPKILVTYMVGLAAFFAKRPLLAFALFYILLCTRCVLWLTDAQFFIEDGPEFYAPAYNEGISTLTREYASYFHAVHRILALIAAIFPVRYGPLAMEYLGMAVQAAAATYVVSRRLAGQIPSDLVRLTAACVLIAHPYSDELFANVAHGQWYLGIISLGIIYADPCKDRIIQAGEGVVLALSCLTGPFAPAMAIFAWVRLRREKIGLSNAIIATATASITLVEILTHNRSGLSHPHRYLQLERMIVNQVVQGPILGFDYLKRVPMYVFFDPVKTAIAWFGIAVILFGLRKSPAVIRALACLGLFCSVSSLFSQATWFGLGNPGMGERYFFYLGIVFLLCLYMLSRTANSSTIRWICRIPMVYCATAIVSNWVYPAPFSYFDFPPQIAPFAHLKPGESLVIETPGSRLFKMIKWKTQLIKK